MRLIARSSRLDAGGRRVEAVSPKPYGLNPKPYSLQSLAAASRFGRYGPMDKHKVRQPDVTGQSYLEQARRTRQMLRSMDPEKVKQVIEFHRDLNFFEALALAQREGKLIVPNDIHDRILTETKDPEERSSPDCSDRTMGILSPRATSLLGDRDFNRSREICSTEQTDRDRRLRDEQYLKQNYPVWTGTLVIYEAPNVSFGEQLVSSWGYDGAKYSISFKVPKQFRGLKNCALVVEHPDFDLIALGNNKYELRIDGQNVHQIDVFPKKDGCYIPHAETGVPQGENAEANSNTRHLYRLNDSSYTGLLVRFVGGYGSRQYVIARCRASDRFRVAFVGLGLGEAAPEK